MSAVILPVRRRDPHIAYTIADRITVALVDAPPLREGLNQTFPLYEEAAAQEWAGVLQRLYGWDVRFRAVAA